MSDTTSLVLFGFLANIAYLTALMLVTIGLGILTARRREHSLPRKRDREASSEGGRIRRRMTRNADFSGTVTISQSY